MLVLLIYWLLYRNWSGSASLERRLKSESLLFAANKQQSRQVQAGGSARRPIKCHSANSKLLRKPFSCLPKVAQRLLLLFRRCQRYCVIKRAILVVSVMGVEGIGGVGAA